MLTNALIFRVHTEGLHYINRLKFFKYLDSDRTEDGHLILLKTTEIHFQEISNQSMQVLITYSDICLKQCINF